MVKFTTPISTVQGKININSSQKNIAKNTGFMEIKSQLFFMY